MIPLTHPAATTTMIRLHAYESCSYANGPGARAVIWLQGCTLACPGCYNPATHAPTGGVVVPVADLLGWLTVDLPRIEGVTLSGGEPLQQVPAVTVLAQALRPTGRSLLIWTGYPWSAVQRLPGIDALLPLVDVIIAGPYRADQRISVAMRGSANKAAIFLTNRYTEADLAATPTREVIVRPDGTVVLTGVNPLPPTPWQPMPESSHGGMP